MATHSASHLVVIASNPPLTSGARTLSRVEAARCLLGYDRAEVANLFAVATHRTGEIGEKGAKAEPWLTARPGLARALARADAVLLAYGVTKPTGSAAGHHAEQLRWLHHALDQRQVPVFWVGDAPRHPSRWQRHTSRMFPGEPFLEALAKCIDSRLLGVDNHGL